MTVRPQRPATRLLCRFAALMLLLVCGVPAAAEIAGTWQVLEKDPLLDDDNWFGHFRYELVIERSGDGYVLTVPRTGAKFGPAELKNGRLVAQGNDPNRGPAQIELRFPEANRLEGRLEVARARRVLSGTLDPTQQLANVGGSVETARQQAAAADQRATAADQRAAAAEAQASQAAAAAQQLRQQVAALNAENQRLKAAAAAPRPAPPPAPARRAAPSEGVSLELIEPPLDDSGVATLRGEQPVLVGRARAAAGLMILRVNGQDATPNAQGVFRAALAPGTTAVEIVAIDRNGTRRALVFPVRQAAPPLRTAPPAPASGPAPVDDSPAARCYAQAIAAAKPDEAALGPCREAVRADPRQAINHYNLGVALSRLGRHAEAIMSYQEAAGRWAR